MLTGSKRANFIKSLVFSLGLGLSLVSPALAQSKFFEASQSDYIYEVERSELSNLEKLPKQRPSKSLRANRLSPSKGKLEKLKLPSDAGEIEFELEAWDIRSENYKSLVNGQETANSAEVSLFKGESPDGKFARLSFITNGDDTSVRGFYGDVENMYQLRSDNISGADKVELRVRKVTKEDLEQVINACGTEDEHGHHTHDHSAKVSPSFERATASDSSDILSATTTAPPILSSTLRVLDVATDADFEYFQDNPNTNAEIMAILFAVDAIYQAELGVTINVTFQNVWTTASDPYTQTDASALLGQLLTYWNSNFASSQTYDVAHLFTGKNLDGSTAGVAYLGATCSIFRYGLSQGFDSDGIMIPLVAHEIGHNLGSDHDSCSGSDSFIMCPSLRSGANEFSSASRAMIADHLSSNGANCLATSGDGTPDPEPDPEPNRAPVLSSIGSRVVSEGQTLRINLSATDADGDSLSFSATSLPAGSSFTGQTFTFVPADNFVPSSSTFATVSVTFRVSDPSGASDSETVSIRVNLVNRPPSIASIPDTSIVAGELLQLQFFSSDPDGDALTFFSTNLPAGAQLTDSGTFSWIPTEAQVGVSPVTITTRDPFGSGNSDSFFITIFPAEDINLAPPLPGEGDSDDYDGDGILNGSDTDDDNDGVSDAQEALDGSNPFDASSFLFRLSTNFCTDWNGFVNQVFNIAEINNFTSSDKEMVANLYDLGGSRTGSARLNILAGAQSDLLAHGIPGWQLNSFGRVCMNPLSSASDGDLDGRMLHYKPSESGGFDYVLNFPFSNPQSGELLVQYNTFHPSLAVNEANNLAVNFLSISNAEVSDQTGQVIMYGQAGEVLNSSTVTVPAAGRIDLSIHDAPGVGFDRVGLIRWIPNNNSAGFQVTLNRYAYDGSSPFDEVVEAVSLPATLGSRQTQVVPVDTRGMTSVLELSNASDEASETRVIVNNGAGQIVMDQSVFLGANATQHIVLDGDLVNSLGQAQITANQGSSIIVNALQYGRTANAGVRTMYHIQAREGLGSVMQGTYNTFLNQECFMYLGNTRPEPSRVFMDLTRTDGQRVVSGEELIVPGSGVLEVNVCGLDIDNTFGVVRITPESPNSVVGTVVRVGEADSYRISTAVR